ncbi:DNA-3-methyladenine glycosylase [Mariniblastus sp.]|jgi:DNA-3-methyladenine glycosylase II|nr:DNA-3-methyladenine glycosylase [Mariniblastus sp.]MDB4756081.1 DNA-3-methyladenine glycosylase [Mariniblastus sp.]
MPFSAQHIKTALTHLKKSDPVMRQVIRSIGPFTHKLSRHRFDMLVNSILSQQISVAAASTIKQRLRELANQKVFTSETILELDVETLRSIGVSRQKANYILDLSEKTANGSVNFRGFSKKNNEEIIQELTSVRGIGRWTAQMFLMFSMGRLDIFPSDDLGLRNSMIQLYDLPESPNKKDLAAVAEKWQPYATVACWYCWKSLDSPK